MARRNWFLSVVLSGWWFLMNGLANVREVEAGSSFQADLYFSEDTQVYQSVLWSEFPGGAVSATVTPGEGEAFPLQGQAFVGQGGTQGNGKVVLLTDGTTVLGLAFGPLSNEGNL